MSRTDFNKSGLLANGWDYVLAAQAEAEDYNDMLLKARDISGATPIGGSAFNTETILEMHTPRDDMRL